jgi:hypothetical protein
MNMLYTLAAGGCYFPVQFFRGYNVLLSPGEGETLKTWELIYKKKNGFGDMIYSIRDHKGIIHQIWERDVETFLKKNGVPFLIEGIPYEYPSKP